MAWDRKWGGEVELFAIAQLKWVLIPVLKRAAAKNSFVGDSCFEPGEPKMDFVDFFLSSVDISSYFSINGAVHSLTLSTDGSPTAN
jgi:hypothetical protein